MCWENLIKDQGMFSLLIILLILITSSLDNVWISLGENWCQSPLELEGLKKRRKEGSAWIPSNLSVSCSPTFKLVNLVFFCQINSFECEHLFIDKPIVIIKTAEPGTWLLGLSSKLYLSNMQFMRNKDLTWFKQSQVCQKRASKRKGLVAGRIFIFPV